MHGKRLSLERLLGKGLTLMRNGAVYQGTVAKRNLDKNKKFNNRFVFLTYKGQEFRITSQGRYDKVDANPRKTVLKVNHPYLENRLKRSKQSRNYS